jgi:hypothetical protein
MLLLKRKPTIPRSGRGYFSDLDVAGLSSLFAVTKVSVQAYQKHDFNQVNQ